MNDRIVAIDDRLAHADENLERIKETLRTYYASDAYRISGEFDPNEGRGARATGAIIPPPLRLFTLTGDVLHEWRSSLDQLMWQLVCANGGQPGDETVMPLIPVAPLPIKRGPNRGTLPWPNVQGGLSDEARQILAGAQPYVFGADFALHPLYQLHELNIIDKHRHVAIKRAGLFNLVIAGDDPLPWFTWTARTITSSEYGAEVQLLPDEADVDVDARATLQVMLHEPDAGVQQPLLKTLEVIRLSVWTLFLDIERDCFPA